MELDEGLMDLYSRQIGAFGLETMAKLTQMRVLIVGMGGVGVEIAKNLTLAGPKAVTILDAGIAEAKDMGANFFITEEDLGGRRGASRAALRANDAHERAAHSPLPHLLSRSLLPCAPTALPLPHRSFLSSLLPVFPPSRPRCADTICVPKLSELNPNVTVSVLTSNPEASGKEELKAFKGLVRELKKRSVSDADFVTKLAALPASGAQNVLRALLDSGKIDVAFVRSSNFDADDMLLACAEAGRVAKSELADFLGTAATPADDLFAAAVASFDMIVLTSSTRSVKVKWNKFCRNFAVTATSDRLAESKTPLPIGFISCDMRGLAGSAFVDFGPGFQCRDANGEAEVTRVITSIVGDTVALDVAHVATGVHGVNVESESEGWIKFIGVKGMVDAEGVSINDSGAWRAKLVERVVRREKAGTDGEMEIAVQTNGRYV